MSATTWGLVTGLVVGFATAFGGFAAFLVVLVFGVVGLLAGRAIEGKLDVSQLIGRER